MSKLLDAAHFGLVSDVRSVHRRTAARKCGPGIGRTVLYLGVIGCGSRSSWGKVSVAWRVVFIFVPCGHATTVNGPLTTRPRRWCYSRALAKGGGREHLRSACLATCGWIMQRRGP